MSTRHKLAIDGGTPVRTRPFPSWPIYGEPEERKLLEVLRSGKWGRIGATEVAKFEQRFAEYHGAKHGIAMVNGTVSLRIALMAAEIHAGDEVIVPPYTFLATASAVVEANAVPVFVDIERETFNIDPRAVEAAITPRTRAIIPVHVGGLAADMDVLMAIAKRHHLIVIEDAAHAHAGEFKGRKLGSLGHMGSFSFQSSKNLTSGEGGIIITSDDKFGALCRSMHDCGRVSGGAWYEHQVIGANYRMTEFQGALLNCQMDRLEEQTRTRNANGLYLNRRFSKIPGITPQARTEHHTLHAYHLFLFRYDEQVFGVPRGIFVKAMQAEGIPASAGYTVPIHRQPLFANLNFGPYTGYRATNPDLDYKKIPCPVCDQICAREGGWLPQNVLLGTRQDMDDIANAFEKVYEHRADLPRLAAQRAEEKK